MHARLMLPTLLLALTTAAYAAAPRTPAPNRQSGTFDSAGVKIAYVTAGTGDNVILIHGLYSSALMNWELPGIFAELAQHHHVVAFDLRGHGQSDKPTADDAYGQPMVDDLTRLMDHLKIQKAHIVGYSLGGIIVMKFMSDHPDRVLSGTLGGMGWLKDGSFEQTFFENTEGRAAGRLSPSTPPACAKGIAKLALTEKEAKAIKLPVHIFIGDRDPCDKLYVEPLTKLQPTWPITKIPEAGHLNCIAKPEFKDGILKWLDERTKAQTANPPTTKPEGHQLQ